jgi:flavin reductase (DIM6/NTAB) family NADH-FMN oxidoreductase RutF
MSATNVEPITSAVFREALGHFASGVTVVTARGETGPVGFTATGFTSVSLTPPLVLVCVGKRASVHDVVVGADCFGVSLLSEGQRSVAEQFARSGHDRFAGVPVRHAGAPLLDGAVVQLECRHHARHDAGDHTILVGEVLSAAIGNDAPLVHHRRRYGRFTIEAPGAGELARAANGGQR